MKNTILVGLLSSMLVICIGNLAVAGEIESYQVVKISAQDHRAVIKSPDGKLQVVGVGDVLADSTKEVSEQRLVVEEVTSEGLVTTIIRLGGDQQRVETLSPQGGELPRIVAPVRYSPDICAIHESFYFKAAFIKGGPILEA